MQKRRVDAAWEQKQGLKHESGTKIPVSTGECRERSLSVTTPWRVEEYTSPTRLNNNNSNPQNRSFS